MPEGPLIGPEADSLMVLRGLSMFDDRLIDSHRPKPEGEASETTDPTKTDGAEAEIRRLGSLGTLEADE